MHPVAIVRKLQNLLEILLALHGKPGHQTDQESMREKAKISHASCITRLNSLHSLF